MKKQTKYSISSWEKFHNQWPLFSYMTSTYQIIAGNMTQQWGNSLECMEDNFLPQLGRDPAWESAPLGLFFVNRELLSDVMVGGFIGHSDHDRQFSTLRKVRRRVCRFATLVFQREILACLGNWLMESLGSSPEGQGVQDSWTFCKKEILRHRNRL